MTVQDMIRAEALRQGVPTELAIAVARRESNFRQTARGAAGEVGVFQLMPGTAVEMRVNPYDLAANIRGGVGYLAKQYSVFGNWTQALQAYNGGARHVIERTVSPAAQNYARAIAPYAVVPSPNLPGFEPLIDSSTLWAAWTPDFELPSSLDVGGVPAPVVIAAAVVLALALA